MLANRWNLHSKQLSHSFLSKPQRLIPNVTPTSTASTPLPLFLYKFLNEIEYRFIAGEDGVLPGIMDSVVIFVCITMLVHEEDARHIPCGKGVMVTIVGELLSVQCLEVSFFCVYLFKQAKPRHSFLAYLAIEHRVVVGNHIQVNEVFYL